VDSNFSGLHFLKDTALGRAMAVRGSAAAAIADSAAVYSGRQEVPANLSSFPFGAGNIACLVNDSIVYPERSGVPLRTVRMQLARL